MKKTTKKALAKVLVIVTLLVATIGISSFAAEAKDIQFTPDLPDDTQAKNIVNRIIGIIQFIGVAIALGMLIIIGIKYVTADPNEKASIKDQAIVYLFGAVLIFAAVGVLEGLKSLLSTITAQ